MPGLWSGGCDLCTGPPGCPSLGRWCRYLTSVVRKFGPTEGGSVSAWQEARWGSELSVPLAVSPRVRWAPAPGCPQPQHNPAHRPQQGASQPAGAAAAADLRATGWGA